MKVCIFTSVFSNPFDHRLFHKEAKTLAGAGYDVTLIAQHDKDEMVDGVRIVALAKPMNRLWRMTVTAWRAFHLAFKEKADVYHFHDPEQLPWGWLLKKLTNKPAIYDVHENYADIIVFKDWMPYLLRKPAAWIFNRIEKILAGRVSAIITATEPMKQRFSDYHPLCVSVCNFPTLEIAMRASESKELGSENAQYSIIYTGRIAKAKGFETILDALDLVVKRTSEATCVILAEAGNLAWLDGEHDSLMKRLIKEGSLKIIGRVPHPEVFRYLNASSMGWKPGPIYQEGISTKTLEYMACGKPVVASDFTLIADIIREAKCGIPVDPYDANDHASAIIYLLEHAEEAKKMGENGRKAVMEKYNWESESKKLLDLYERLLGEG